MRLIKKYYFHGQNKEITPLTKYFFVFDHVVFLQCSFVEFVPCSDKIINQTSLFASDLVGSFDVLESIIPPK